MSHSNSDEGARMPVDPAYAALKCFREYGDHLAIVRKRPSSPHLLPETSVERRQVQPCSAVLSTSLSSGSLSSSFGHSTDTVLYLAYGSNLSDETFRGNRGIKPLSAINVQVPELRLTFDLPGIPYAEPCFANSARRDPQDDRPSHHERVNVSEKMPLLQRDAASSDGYHKDRWHKGMIGVVYEVTPTDYATIIATEGGGSGYQDILVDCHPFESSDPKAPVPQNPTTQSFRVHTLFAPSLPEGSDPPADGGRISRPDPSYAQASARYLKLITDGAAERQLPYEYQDYLHSLRPYTITMQKQRLGQFVFGTLWFPFIMLIFAMNRAFEDKNGQAPKWLRLLAGAIFQAVWASYDGYFKDLFGDGERTVEKHDEEDPNPDAVSPRANEKSSQQYRMPLPTT